MSTLQDLFSRDPLECSDADIEALVADYRSKRHLYALGDQKAGNVKPKAGTKLNIKLALNT